MDSVTIVLWRNKQLFRDVPTVKSEDAKKAKQKTRKKQILRYSYSVKDTVIFFQVKS